MNQIAVRCVWKSGTTSRIGSSTHAMDLAAMRRTSEAHAMRMGETRESAEDIAQDALLRIHRHPAEGDWKTYVIRITSNLVKDARKYRRRRPLTGPWDPVLDGIVPLPEIADAPMFSDRDRLMLSVLVASLSEPMRTTVLMELAGRHYKEIAAETMTPPGTVRSRLSRAHGLMREHLASLVKPVS